MFSSSSSTIPSGTQSSRSGKSNIPVKDYFFFFITKKIPLLPFRNLKYALWGAIVVVIIIQWYFFHFLSSSCSNYPSSTNPILSSRSDLSSSASKKVLENDGFFPRTLMFSQRVVSENYQNHIRHHHINNLNCWEICMITLQRTSQQVFLMFLQINPS